jgi:DNA helicase IV
MDIATFAQYGALGVCLFVAYKAIAKLYDDMRSDSQQRETKLMEHLDKQAATMQDISNTLQSMDNRICKLESKNSNVPTI